MAVLFAQPVAAAVIPLNPLPADFRVLPMGIDLSGKVYGQSYADREIRLDVSSVVLWDHLSDPTLIGFNAIPEDAPTNTYERAGFNERGWVLIDAYSESRLRAEGALLVDGKGKFVDPTFGHDRCLPSMDVRPFALVGTTVYLDDGAYWPEGRDCSARRSFSPNVTYSWMWDSIEGSIYHISNGPFTVTREDGRFFLHTVHNQAPEPSCLWLLSLVPLAAMRRILV